MTKRHSSQSGFDVGYGKPPAASRFSSTNQPSRTKARGLNSIDLGAEKRAVRREGGKIDKISVDEAIIEVSISKALGGDISHAKYLYDREEREFNNQSRRKAPAPNMRNLKKFVPVVAAYLRRFDRIHRQLLADRLVAPSLSGKLEISDRVTFAIETRSRGGLD